jgi:hypothetical protein
MFWSHADGSFEGRGRGRFQDIILEFAKELAVTTAAYKSTVLTSQQFAGACGSMEAKVLLYGANFK